MAKTKTKTVWICLNRVSLVSAGGFGSFTGRIFVLLGRDNMLLMIG